jgi:cell division protein FtsQ
MNKYLNLIKTVFLFSLFIFLLSFTNKRNNERVAKEMIFERDEQNFIKNQVLENLITSYNPVEFGDKIHLIDLFDLEKKLDNHAFIKKSEVYATPDGIIHTKITEEKPLIRVKTPQKEFYLTDENKAIPLSKLYSPEVLIIAGEIEQNEYKNICDLVKYVNEDNLLKNHIVGIRKAGKNFFIFMTDKEFEIEFGALVKKEEKFDNLKLFYTQYLGKLPSQTYKKISIRFNNQVIAVK